MHNAMHKKGLRDSVTAGDVALREGWLKKKSHGAFKHWQKRYFRLSGHSLTYYADETTDEVKGACDLNTVTLCVREELSIQVTAPGEELLLRAASDQDAEKWQTSLLLASAASSASASASAPALPPKSSPPTPPPKPPAIPPKPQFNPQTGMPMAAAAPAPGPACGLQQDLIAAPGIRTVRVHASRADAGVSPWQTADPSGVFGDNGPWLAFNCTARTGDSLITGVTVEPAAASAASTDIVQLSSGAFLHFHRGGDAPALVHIQVRL
jgi:hypothetical protein